MIIFCEVSAYVILELLDGMWISQSPLVLWITVPNNFCKRKYSFYRESLWICVIVAMFFIQQQKHDDTHKRKNHPTKDLFVLQR